MRKPILMLPYSPVLSHVSRLLELAKALRKKNYEVIFAGSGSQMKQIKDEGFAIRYLAEPPVEELFGNIRKRKIRFIQKEELMKYILADIELFDRLDPALVISDGRISASISTQIYGVKHGAICNVSSTEFRAIPYIPIFRNISDNPTSGAVQRLVNTLNVKLECSLFDRIMDVFTTISNQYHLKHQVTATNFLNGVNFTLMPDIPEYFPTKNIPSNYHYLGPLTWKPRLPLPSWYPLKNRTRSVVYLTMGTTGYEEFFSQVYEIFKNSPYLCILTTGKKLEGIETIEDKIYVTDYLDGDLAMDAADVVICHGGNGTIYQALKAGKPIIGIPAIPDQEYNLRRVETLGLGKSLSWKTIGKNPNQILTIIASILKNKVYRENTQKMAKIINNYHPVDKAVKIIESYLSEQGRDNADEVKNASKEESLESIYALKI